MSDVVQPDPEIYFPVITKSRKRRTTVSSHDAGSQKRLRIASPIGEIRNGDDPQSSSDHGNNAFDPDKIPLLHTQQLRKATEAEVSRFESDGVVIKRGPFSPAESARVLQNYEDYVNEIGGVYSELFGVGRVRSKERREKLRFSNFFARLAHGLPNRHVWYVYLHARKICHPAHSTKTQRNRYTEEEMNTIIRMKLVDGKDFVAIGAALNRTPQSVCDRFRNIASMGDRQKTGPFDEADLLQLTMCVSDVHGFTNFNAARRLLWRQINWQEVVIRMENRSLKACKNAWKYLLFPDCCTPSRGQFYFLCCLVRVYARGGNAVPWNRLAKDVGLPDGYIAQACFHSRKGRVFTNHYPDVDMTSISLKKAAKKIMRWLRDQRIPCFQDYQSLGDGMLDDIPGLNSKHNRSKEYWYE